MAGPTSRLLAVSLALALVPFAVAAPLPGADKPAGPHTDSLGDSLPAGAVARIGTTRLRHLGAVGWLRYTPDGKGLVSLGQDNSLCIWDAAHGKNLHRFARDDGSSWYQSAGDDRRILMMARFRGGRFSGREIPPVTVAASADGKLLAVGELNAVRVWDAITGKEQRRIELAADKEKELFGVPVVAVSGDGKRLAAGCMGRSDRESVIHLYDLPAGRELRTLRVPPGAPAQLLFSPNGAMLAGLSDDGVRLWDLASGKRIRTYQGHENTIMAVAFSANSQRLATASQDKTVRLWELDSEEELARFEGPENGFLCVAFSLDSRTVAAGDFTGNVWMWEAAQGKDKVAQKLTVQGRPGPVRSLAFSPDGKSLATGGEGGEVRLWDLASGKERSEAQRPDPVVVVRWPDGGRSVAVAGVDGSVRHADPATGKVSRSFTGAGANVRFLGLSADGKRIIVGTEDAANAFQVWDVTAGKELYRGTTDAGAAGLAAFSPDGRVLASTGGVNSDGVPWRVRRMMMMGMVPEGSADVVKLWDAATGKELRRLELRALTSALAFAPDGRAFAMAGEDGQVGVYETATGKQRCRFPVGKGSVQCLAWSPDGRRLATGAGDEAVRLWDVATGRVVRGLMGHRGDVVAVAWSPDGKRLASGGDDGTVRLWDPATGEEVGRFTGHQGAVRALAFSPDGKQLLSGGRDTTALVWEVAAARSARPADPALAKLEQLWADLGSDDAAAAHRAICAVAVSPGEAVPFLATRLKPVPAVDPKRLAQLIADLDSDDFAARRKASEELEALGPQAAAALKEAMAKPSAKEAEKRLKGLVEKLEQPRATPDRLRAGRVLEALEKAGTAEARKVLAALAGGAADAWLTQEAKAALKRVNARSGSGP